MPYSHTNWLQLRMRLAERLTDVAHTYWVDAELALYLREALRTWASYTGFWRERGSFNTVAATPFYALPAYLPTLLGYTVTDLDVVTAIQYHLIEAVGVPWVGTAMFTLAELTEASERRRNQFLLETGAVITRLAPVAVPPPTISRVPLADSVIDVRRAAWVDAGGKATPLRHGDEWEFTSFSPLWAITPSTPASFSVIAPPPLTLQLAPPPIAVGTLDLLTVSTGATLNPATPVLLGIPDNFSWVIKWGALADLLAKAGPAFDFGRSAYCQLRWQEGVELARIFPSVVQAAINGVPVLTQTVADFDTFASTWQQSSGVPTAIGLAGWNMLALASVPDAGPYSITLDVVRNAPQPVLDTDFIQVGREDLDAILDYAQHLSSFKTGGMDFQATIPMLERFKRHAAVSADRLPALSAYYETLRGQTMKEAKQRPRRQTDVVAAV